MTHCPISKKPCPHNCQERCPQDHVSFKGETHEFREAPKGWHKADKSVSVKRELTEDEKISVGLLAIDFVADPANIHLGKTGYFINGWAACAASNPSPAELQQQAELIKQMREDIQLLHERLSNVRQYLDWPILDEVNAMLTATAQYQQPQ